MAIGQWGAWRNCWEGGRGVISSDGGSSSGVGGGGGGSSANGGGGGRGGGGGGDADPELMTRSRVALLAAFSEVFGVTLVHRGGAPPV